MKYDVIYEKANGALTKKSFTNMKDAFEGMLRVSSSIVRKRSVDGAIEQMKPIV